VSVKKKLAGRALLVFASVAIAIGIGEIAVRAAHGEEPGGDDSWYVRYRRMNETLYRRSDDPELVYEPRPSSAVEMEYGRAAFNGASMRDDREHELAPDPSRTRVALVGDSLVWGEFIALRDTLAPRIESLSPDLEVLNFGVTGYDTAQEARWYERAVRPFSPRVVVVLYCMNDMMIMSGPFERYANRSDRRRKTAQERWIEREAPVRRETIDRVIEDRERDASIKVLARAFGLIERWRFAHDYTDEYLVAFADRERRSNTARAIARLGRAIAADGARPILIVSPVLEAWDDYHWGRVHDFVRRHGERAGFTVIDPIATWREDPEALRVSGDNLHYGGYGHQVLAREIAAAIE
jgi:lysophospholipase L1-like esterase